MELSVQRRNETLIEKLKCGNGKVSFIHQTHIYQSPIIYKALAVASEILVKKTKIFALKYFS